MALERGRPVLFPGIETVDNWDHTVAKAHALHPFIVIAGLAEADPAEPGAQQVFSLELDLVLIDGGLCHYFVSHIQFAPFLTLYM